MRVIGTAGHVDHGKSTLVKALTGIDPDRLKEEKKRQMTIELGFAWFESQSEGEIGIVDVPGHRDFIDTMLAGVGGIDAVLLVIAADEGIMPQTKEHLAIIELLRVNTGLVVLTKVDLVDDPAWLELVEMDIRERLSSTCLENAPLLRVSAVTGDGIAQLRAAIEEVLAPLPPRLDLGRPRLPIDRIFSLTGFGTVVTGTLLNGSLCVDNEVEILPSRRSARIRGLQTHKRSEETALPGSRTAVNLSGVDVADIKRGEVITLPRLLEPTQRIDAQIELLQDAPVSLKHNDLVKVFALTSECAGRVRVLQGQELKPGENGWVQIEFEKEMVLEKEDRFIIRRMSPAHTLGGGVVVNPHPGRRYRLQDSSVIERLSLNSGTALENRILALLMEKPFITVDEIQNRLETDSERVREILAELTGRGQVSVLAGLTDQTTGYLPRAKWAELTAKSVQLLQHYHQQNPLKSGINVDELARRLRISQDELNLCLREWLKEKVVKLQDGAIALPGFEVRYSSNQSRRLEQFTAILDQQPFLPPGVKESKDLLTDDVFQSLVERGALVQLSTEVVVRKAEYGLMLGYVIERCSRGELLTLAQFRDHFNTNRKVSQAFLEFLDRKGVTQRVGEGRVLKKKPPKNPSLGAE
mgnify:CR=1 FL=1|jgi:selenocysteine-specific elongation factor